MRRRSRDIIVTCIINTYIEMTRCDRSSIRINNKSVFYPISSRPRRCHATASSVGQKPWFFRVFRFYTLSLSLSHPNRSSAITDMVFRLIRITHNTRTHHIYIYIYTTVVVRGWLKTRYDPLGNGPAIGSAVDLGIRAHEAQLIAPTMDDRHNIIILLLYISL